LKHPKRQQSTSRKTPISKNQKQCAFYIGEPIWLLMLDVSLALGCGG